MQTVCKLFEFDVFIKTRNGVFKQEYNVVIEYNVT